MVVMGDCNDGDDNDDNYNDDNGPLNGDDDLSASKSWRLIPGSCTCEFQFVGICGQLNLHHRHIVIIMTDIVLQHGCKGQHSRVALLGFACSALPASLNTWWWSLWQWGMTMIKIKYKTREIWISRHKTDPWWLWWWCWWWWWWPARWCCWWWWWWW